MGVAFPSSGYNGMFSNNQKKKERKKEKERRKQKEKGQQPIRTIQEEMILEHWTSCLGCGFWSHCCPH